MPKDVCFVIMPFRPELHYMYLYLQEHLEKNFNLTCTRGDAKILTGPLLEKIKADIRSAHVIIADCTGRNPNVFYELGMAHALDKPVVLITSDTIDQAPSDIRCFEFIKYDLDDHLNFLARLENALRNVLGQRFEAYYQPAVELFEKFCNECGYKFDTLDEGNFIRVSVAKERSLRFPPPENKQDVAYWLLASFLPSPIEVATSNQMIEWIEKQTDLLLPKPELG